MFLPNPRPYPYPFPTPRPRPICPPPWLNRDRQWHGNLPDSNVGQNGWRCFPFIRHERTNGWGIDLNKNGRYDRGRDGVLVFDTNRDGKYDKRDVSNTNDMMKAASGNFDFNGDGRVSWFEKIRGGMLKNQFRRYDRNGDGRLQSWEISQGGGKVWIDRNRNGKIGGCELHSPYRLPGGLFEPNGRTLDHVDPRWGSRTSTNNPWWERPCCRFRPLIGRPQICIGRPSIYY